MPGIYSRNPYTIPQQGPEDPFAVDYFQPSEILPVQYGSTAGGQAVRNATAFANPGYGPSRLDRYAGDAQGYGNEPQGYEDGLQLDAAGIGKYYDTVNKLNDLSLKAEHLGFNIKKPDFRDQLQRQLFTEYQQHLQDAHTSAMTLKHGKALQDEVRKAYIEGKVFNPQSPEYQNQGTFTDQNLANSVRTVADPASQDFNKYNAKTYNDPAAYGIAHTRRTGLVQVEQQVIDHANAILADRAASYDEKQAALADKHEAEQNQLRYAQPTLDNNEILNRAQRERFERDKKEPDNSEILFKSLNRINNGEFNLEEDGKLKNTDLSQYKYKVGSYGGEILYVQRDPHTGQNFVVVNVPRFETNPSTKQQELVDNRQKIPIGSMKAFALKVEQDNPEVFGTKSSIKKKVIDAETSEGKLDFTKLGYQTTPESTLKGYDEIAREAHENPMDETTAAQPFFGERVRKAKAKLEAAKTGKKLLSREALAAKAAAAGYTLEEYLPLVKDKIILE